MSSGGTILVGVDGSAGSQEALRFGLAEARLRGARLRALIAWSLPPVVDVPGAMVPSLTEDFRADAERALDDALGAADLEGVEVERRVVEGGAARALIEASHEADLLVVGSRGHGGFLGLLLGSVADRCVRRAHCPVAVVRPGGG